MSKESETPKKSRALKDAPPEFMMALSLDDVEPLDVTKETFKRAQTVPGKNRAINKEKEKSKGKLKKAFTLKSADTIGSPSLFSWSKQKNTSKPHKLQKRGTTGSFGRLGKLKSFEFLRKNTKRDNMFKNFEVIIENRTGIDDNTLPVPEDRDRKISNISAVSSEVDVDAPVEIDLELNEPSKKRSNKVRPPLPVKMKTGQGEIDFALFASSKDKRKLTVLENEKLRIFKQNEAKYEQLI